MIKGPTVDDAEFIADRIAALEESVRYFSSENKAERERWVVEALLENMNIPHRAEDVVSPEQDPPDVLALGCEFAVKEILDPGRKRHQEYKEELERAETVTDPQDLLTGFTPVDSSVQEIFQLCSTEIEKLRNNTLPGYGQTWICCFTSTWSTFSGFTKSPLQTRRPLHRAVGGQSPSSKAR
ncbi:MAG: DUF1780 domain-containing protein [Methylococcaceae bacterium]|nr:DUF1780 domain-containing protein [Methylococcaceae bacterium]